MAKNAFNIASFALYYEGFEILYILPTIITLPLSLLVVFSNSYTCTCNVNQH